MNVNSICRNCYNCEGCNMPTNFTLANSHRRDQLESRRDCFQVGGLIWSRELQVWVLVEAVGNHPESRFCIIPPATGIVDFWQLTTEAHLGMALSQRAGLCLSLWHLLRGSCLQWQVRMEVKVPSFLASIQDLSEGPSQFQNLYKIDKALSCNCISVQFLPLNHASLPNNAFLESSHY